MSTKRYSCGCPVNTSSAFYAAGYEVPDPLRCDAEAARWHHLDLVVADVTALSGEWIRLTLALTNPENRRRETALRWMQGRREVLVAALRDRRVHGPVGGRELPPGRPERPAIEGPA